MTKPKKGTNTPPKKQLKNEQPKPDYKIATHDFLEEFTQAQWDDLSLDERFDFYEDDDSQLARNVRIRLRAAIPTESTPALVKGELVTLQGFTDEPITAQVGNSDIPGAVSLQPVNNPAAANDTGRESLLSIVGGVTTAQLKQALEIQTEQRALIKQFIADNLEEGIDYGKIHVVKNCPMEAKQHGSCDRDYHYSKSIMMKPGQEKIFSLFGITEQLERDDEVYEMLQVPGMVAYKCVMYRGTNRVGEGRGAATLGGSQNDPNSTIKKAEKRARMDACLSLGFSAYFTQDLDDPEYRAQREMMNSRAAAEAERKDKDEFGLMPRDPSLPVDNAERTVLYRMTLKAGIEDSEIVSLLKVNGIADPGQMTSGQARDMMSRIRNNAFAAPAPAVKNPEPVYTDLDSQDVSTALDDYHKTSEPVAPPPEPAKIVVDDTFMSEVHAMFTNLDFNARGEMWFKQEALGKPFGSWENFTEQEWIRAYNLVMGITDKTIAVKDGYRNAEKIPAPPIIDYSIPTKDQPTEPTKEDLNAGGV